MMLKKKLKAEMGPDLFSDPVRRPVLSGLLDVRLPLLIRQVLPDLSDLFDPICPAGMIGLQVGVVLIGVQDHRNRCLTTQRLIALPLQQLTSLRGGTTDICWSRSLFGTCRPAVRRRGWNRSWLRCLWHNNCTSGGCCHRTRWRTRSPSS